MTVDQMCIPSQCPLMIWRGGNFDAAWATVFLHSAANHKNTFPKPKTFPDLSLNACAALKYPPLSAVSISKMY